MGHKQYVNVLLLVNVKGKVPVLQKNGTSDLCFTTLSNEYWWSYNDFNILLLYLLEFDIFLTNGSSFN